MKRIGLISSLFLFAAACSQGAAPETGARIRISTGDFAANVASVTVEVTAPGFDAVQTLSQSGSSWTGNFTGIPAGPAHFDAKAFDAAGNKLAEGTVDSLIIGGLFASINIVLTSTTTTDRSLPLIQSVVLSNDVVAPGSTLTATVHATDPNPAETLSYQWTSHDGSFQPAGAATTVWTAPQFFTTRTSEQLTITVSNTSGESISFSVTVTVDPNVATGSAFVDAAIDNGPVLTDVFTSQGFLVPGVSTSFFAEVNNDPGNFNYVWSTSCQDASQSPFGQKNTIQVPFGTADTFCDVTVVVSDAAGSTATAKLRVAVTTGGPVVLVPPSIDATQQSALTVPGSGTVTLSAVAHSPHNDSLQFIWSVSSGVINSEQESFNNFPEENSTISWTVVPGSGPATATVVVRDLVDSSSATHTFTVTSAP